MPKLKKTIAPSLDAMFDQALTYATADMQIRNRVHPGFFGRLANGRLMMIACTDDMMATVATKMVFAMHARKLFREKQVTHYVYVAEIWIASVHLPFAEHARKYDPTIQGDRLEGLMVISGDATQTRARYYYTSRKGKKFDAFKPKTDGAGGGEEWFFNLLQDEPHPALSEWLNALQET